MKRFLTLVLLITICFCSCRQDVLRVYVEEPLRVHSGIIPDDVHVFFEPDSGTSIHYKEYEVDPIVKSEFEKIKGMLSGRPELEGIALRQGRYECAFIYQRDTFYTTHRLRSWSYKNKVGLYDVSEEFRSKFSEHFKWWEY